MAAGDFTDEVDLVNVFGYERDGTLFRAYDMDVRAVNSLLARQKARAFVRTFNPTKVRVFKVETKEERGDAQTTFKEWFPNAWNRNEYRVRVEFAK